MAFEASIQPGTGDQLIILKDKNNGTAAEIFAFGALLNAFRVQAGETTHDLVDGFGSPADAREHILNGFKSAKLSPFVCRLRKGGYRYDGQDFTIEKYFMGEHAIHGLLFDAVYRISEWGSDSEKAFATLEYDYDGHDKGYPFPYRIRIHWQLEKNNRLTVSTTVSHNNAGPIPYTDGWHPYFTLGGSVDDWTLQFNSHQQLEYDADLLPTGNQLRDDRFEKGVLLKGIELDNSFELTEATPVCVLSNQQWKLCIHPDKSYPILQIYIPPQRKSIAIENLSGAPDNFNNHIHLLTIAPGEERTFTTSYTVSAL